MGFIHRLARQWSRTGLRTALAVCAVGALGACATSQQADFEPVQPVDQQAYDYIVGPGDTLDIFVWGYEDLSVKLPVRPDGRITTRLVEDLLASGKTPTVLAREIEEHYKEFVKDPTVTVTVSKFVGSPDQQIKVVGGGAAPQTVPYRNRMTLLDLMIEVGGLEEFASGNRAVLVRVQNGERVSRRVRLTDLLNNGDISANVDLLPGDVLIVPQSWF